jgi:hypothetical protein
MFCRVVFAWASLLGRLPVLAANPIKLLIAPGLPKTRLQETEKESGSCANCLQRPAENIEPWNDWRAYKTA